MNRLISPTGHMLPASEGTLVYFASYLGRSVRHSTIKLYLAAVRNLHITAGYNDSLKGKLLLRKVLRGSLRLQGEKKMRRQPVTPRMLSSIRPVLQAWLSPRDFSMVWADFTLAFFAFLRCSEFRPHFDLSTDCITLQPNLACPPYMTIQLKSSKTDVFRHGQSLMVAHSSSTICAVMAMRDNFLLARPQTGPLFYFQSGRYLTRGIVSHLLQDSTRFAGLPYQCLKGHSFRIRAASVATAAGL